MYAVFKGIKPQWDEAAFPTLIIFLKYSLIVRRACYFTVSMIRKTWFKIFPKRSHRICSNFAIIEAIMAGTYSLKHVKRFLKKTPSTAKHKESCHADPDCNKTQIIGNFQLYIIQLWWPFPHTFTHANVVNAQTWEVSPLKNPVEPP